jgi:hypothetical protein
MSLRTVLILSSHLRLGLPSDPSDFPTKILYAFLTSFRRAACPDHLMFFDLVMGMGDEVAQPYKTTDKIKLSFACYNICVLDSRGEDKRF